MRWRDCPQSPLFPLSTSCVMVRPVKRVALRQAPSHTSLPVKEAASDGQTIECIENDPLHVETEPELLAKLRRLQLQAA